MSFWRRAVLGNGRVVLGRRCLEGRVGRAELGGWYWEGRVGRVVLGGRLWGDSVVAVPVVL